MPKIEIKRATGEDKQTEVVSKSRDRDEYQKALDAEVKGLVAKWKKAGSHEGGTPGPTLRFVVAKDDKAVFKAMVRRAFTLHKHEALWFKDYTREDGQVSVKFGVAKAKEGADAENGKTEGGTPEGGTPEGGTPDGQNAENRERENAPA